jgi:hypothetical protein
MSRWLLPVLLLWAMCGSASAGLTHDPNLTWRTLESAHFRVHFHDGGAETAQRFWPIAERIYSDVCTFLNWHPQGKTDVVLTDEFDLSNGYARVFPYNSVVLFLAAPDDINSLEEYDDWLSLVFRHEFLHVVHLDKVRGAPRWFQRVFGRHPLLFPNAYQPRWVIEGLATYVETDMHKAVGRGQSSYFDMLMRMETLSGLKQIRRVNQPIGSWPAGTIPYLYGVDFFKFVRDKYGEPAIQKMVENYSGNIIPFRINSNSVSVFQKDLPQMWTEFDAWLRHKYDRVKADVVQAGLRAGRPLTSEGYLAGSLQTIDNRIYFYQFTGKTHAAIKMIEGDAPASKLLEVNTGSRFNLHRDKGLLITQPEICRNARVYYDIYRADANGNNLQRLTHCARYRRAIWTGKGDRILAVHDEMGISSLQLLNEHAELIETLWQGTHREQIGKMTSSAYQDFIVASVWRPQMGWNLEKFDLTTRQWTALTHDRLIETEPQFVADGASFLYSADHGGIYNIYRYDLNNNTRTRLTNLIGGGFYPAMSGTRLAYIGYSADGFNVYAMPSVNPLADASAGELNKPEVQTVAKEVPAAETSTAVDTQTTAGGELPTTPYSPWSSLLPTWWSPYFLIDDQHTQLGLTTAGNDVLQRHSYAVSLAYDFKNEQTVGNADYVYDGLWPLFHFGISRDNSLYLDNNNNLVRIRANNFAVFETIVPFIKYDRSISWHAAMIRELDTDVFTNGVAPAPDSRNDVAALAFRYNSAKRYPLSVSRNEGREVRLIYEDSDLYGDSSNKGQVTVGEWREFLRLGGEHVLAFRLTEGHGEGNPKPFRLGGIQSKNTLLSALTNGRIDPLFNKRDYTLRGYSEGLGQLIGKNMRLFSLEYRFPISRIEHGWMTPPFGFNQIHGTLFYDAGGVWTTGTGPDKYYAGAGVELNADLDIFYNIRVRTSLGFAKGLDDTIGEKKVYLRIGSEF